MMEYAIRAEGITKVYKSGRKKVVAVNGITLKIRRGEFYGLLGPNGAGKTTFTKIIATLLLPDAGEAWVNGYSILEDPIEVRKSIGWMMGETGGRALYWRLTGWDNIRFFAALLDVPRDIAEKRAKALLEFLDLSDAANKLVMNYSTGMKIKLMLIRTLIHNPEILILDEPTLGLDVESARKVRSFLKALVEEVGKTILFTSHNMYEVEALCDRIAVINKGQIIFEGTARELREKVSGVKVVEVRVLTEKSELERLKGILESVPSVDGILESTLRDNLGIIRVKVEDPFVAIPDIAERLKGFKVESIGRALPTLEEAFIRIAGSA